MSNNTTIVPVKRGFFHMLGELWDMGTVAIGATKKVVMSFDDLASTANVHTQHIKKTAEVELNAELKALTAQLETTE